MKEPSEVDLILHFMRQSKMDAVRKELEQLAKDCKSKDHGTAAAASLALAGIVHVFKKASNNAPLP